MRPLVRAFFLMGITGLSSWGQASSKCGDVVSQVESVLEAYGNQGSVRLASLAQTGAAKPAAGASEALKTFGISSRNVPDNLNDLQSYSRNVSQDVAFLEARAGRALKDASSRTRAQEAIEAKLKEVNQALAKAKGHSSANWNDLHKAKADLLKLKTLEGRSLQNLETDELLRVQKELDQSIREGGGGTLSGVPENMRAEAELKKAIEAELRKRPAHQQAQKQSFDAAADSFRQQQRQAEINFRNSAGTPAARPLSDSEKSRIESYISRLKENPKGLTETEVRELRQIQQSLSEKQKWQGGDYKGMTSTDLAVTSNLERALDEAARSIGERGGQQVLNLAKEQGRTIGPMKADNFGTDAFGRHSGEARSSARAAGMAEDPGRVAMKKLEGAGTTPASNIQEIATFNPVVTERAAMTHISSTLSRVGVQTENVHAANVVSTLNSSDVDSAPADFRKAQGFLRQVREASRSGELQKAAQSLTESERRSLNQLIETMEAHQRSYVPSHLRNLRVPASP